MRGRLHHLDLTVADPKVSAPFYDLVLGHMGYANVRDDEDGIDYGFGGRLYPSIGIVRAKGATRTRAHDRYSPGLHHVAFWAESRADVDALHEKLVADGITILDPPADYPQYGAGYYAVFFADPDGLKLEYAYTPED